MPLDAAPTASSVIAEARARGYTLVVLDGGLEIFFLDAPRPDDDIDFWWRMKAVPDPDIIAALEAEESLAA